MTVVYFSSILKVKSYDATLSILQKELTDCSVGYKFLSNTYDIWCRDYMPVQIGINQFVQFSLSRDYYQEKDEYLRTDPVPICRELGITPIIPQYNGKPIYLEGGNVIRGYSKAIICDKVFADNHIPKTKLLDILTEVLKVERIIIIPQEPDEYTGHADGMIRILNSGTVLANDYLKIGVDKRFRDKFYGSLTGAGLDILLVPYFPVDSHAYNQPAIGCYINYLQVGQKIFLPTFNDEPKDHEAINRFGEIFGTENVIPVTCSEIAQLGGCLNCLSWEINEHPPFKEPLINTM